MPSDDDMRARYGVEMGRCPQQAVVRTIRTRRRDGEQSADSRRNPGIACTRGPVWQSARHHSKRIDGRRWMGWDGWMDGG